MAYRHSGAIAPVIAMSCARYTMGVYFKLLKTIRRPPNCERAWASTVKRWRFGVCVISGHFEPAFGNDAEDADGPASAEVMPRRSRPPRPYSRRVFRTEPRSVPAAWGCRCAGL